MATPLKFTSQGSLRARHRIYGGGEGVSLRSEKGCALGAGDTDGLSVEDKLDVALATVGVGDKRNSGKHDASRAWLAR